MSESLSLIVQDWVLPRILEQRAAAHPERIYLAMLGEAPISFGSMEHRTRRIANRLAELGVGFGDRVVLMLGNSVAFIEVWLAVSRLGAVLVPVNTALRGDLLCHIINDSGARIAIIGQTLAEVLAAVEAELPALHQVVMVAEPGGPAGGYRGSRRAIQYAELRRGSEAAIAVPVAVHDLAAIMYTSGTTGRSKGVLLPHGHLHLDPQVTIEQLGLTEQDVIYTCLPLFHANALLLGAYCALILGARLALAQRFSASGWIDDIRRSGATVTNLLGGMTDFVYRRPARADDAETSLRVVVAVPTSPSQGPLFEARFGVTLFELYGSTEVNCPIFQPRDLPRRDGSCGVLVDRWYECRLVDPETDLDVAPGKAGELVVRNKAPWTFMAGYHNMPEATLQAWRNLWFHTGDVLRQDEDGFFYFVDRLKDCIRRKGENISALEVEEVLLAHPDVAEVAVVGVVSPFNPLEQEVKACIVARPGTPVDPAALADHCAARMADFMLPRYIEYYPALPRTATEKIQKSVLRTHGIRSTTWASPDANRRRDAGRG